MIANPGLQNQLAPISMRAQWADSCCSVAAARQRVSLQLQQGFPIGIATVSHDSPAGAHPRGGAQAADIRDAERAL